MFSPRAASLPRPTRGHFANRSSHPILNALDCRSSLSFNIPTFKPSTRRRTPISCHVAPPQLTENTAAPNPASANLDAASSLTPLFATLTKNTGGWGMSASFLRVSSAYSASQRYPSLSSTAVSCELLAVSSPRVTPNSFRIRTSAKRTRNSHGIRTSKRQDLKSFRIRTYKKPRGRGPLYRPRYPLKPPLHMAHPYTCTCKKGPAAREPRYSPCAAS
jgi:hypothetical protein